MKRSFTIWLALRYLLAAQRSYGKFVNWVSLASLALGIIMLIVISSIHNGLVSTIEERTLNAIPHIFLPLDDLSDEFVEEFKRHDEVVEISEYFTGLGMVLSGSEAFPVEIRGVSSSKLHDVENLVVFDPDGGSTRGIYLDRALPAVERPGSSITVLFPESGKFGVRAKPQQFKFAGYYSVRTMADYLSIVIPIEELKRRNLIESGDYGLRVTLRDPLLANQVASLFPHAISWDEKFSELFRAYQLEKIILYLLMMLIVVLAAFNIIAGQAMLVNVKRDDIAILHTMGATRELLVKTLALHGAILALTGIVIGVVCGLLISINIDAIFDSFDHLLGIELLEHSVFESMPYEIRGLDLTLGVVAALLITLAASGLPMLKLTKIDPTEILNQSG